MNQPSDDPLPVRTVEFIGGIATPGGWRPDHGLPEIAFSGRSNVGKSSLLNRLVQRRSIARVSHTPGRTREINLFKVNDRFVLADLPGYGFARASKADRAEWRALVEWYLRESPSLAGVVQLLDVRREPSPDDERSIAMLAEIGVPVLIAVTKVDKLTASEAAERVFHLAALLETGEDAIVPVSSRTGAGRDDLCRAILELVAQPNWRTRGAG